MMRKMSGRLRLVCACVGLLAMSAAVSAQQYSIWAVAINGTPITPTQSVSAERGDVITCEIYGSNWSPVGQGLKAWHFPLLWHQDPTVHYLMLCQRIGN